MIVHVLSVKGRAAACDNLALVQGSRGVDRIVLDLDAEWQGVPVEVSFVYGGGAVRGVKKNDDGTYTIPWECMADAGSVRAVVEGRGTNGDVLKHARMDTAFYVQPADFADDAPAPGEPTEAEWRQLAAQAKEAAKTAEDAAADIARRAQAGEFDGERGPQGPQGPKGKDGVRPLSGDGVDVDEAGRCSADIAGACAATCFAGVKVATMADGVTGSAKAVVLPYGLLVTALELNCKKNVQAAGAVDLCGFDAGFKPKAAYSVPVCELPSAAGNYCGASARFETNGTVSLSVYASSAGEVALSIKRGAVPQLFIPFTGGGQLNVLDLARFRVVKAAGETGTATLSGGTVTAKGISNTWQGTGVVFEGLPAGKAVVTGVRGIVGGIVTTGRAVGASDNAHWTNQLGKPARVIPEAALGDATAVDVDEGGTVGFLLKQGDSTFSPRAAWDDSAAGMPALIPEL